MLVDPAQLGQVQALTELMQLADAWHPQTMAQPRKGSPRPMLGQQRNEQIEGMSGR